MEVPLQHIHLANLHIVKMTTGTYKENSHSTRLPDLAINYRFRQCLLPLTSILFAIAQQQDHSPLPSGVIWEGIYITQFMGPQLGAQCRTPYHRYIKMGPINILSDTYVCTWISIMWCIWHGC